MGSGQSLTLLQTLSISLYRSTRILFPPSPFPHIHSFAFSLPSLSVLSVLFSFSAFAVLFSLSVFLSLSLAHSLTRPTLVQSLFFGALFFFLICVTAKHGVCLCVCLDVCAGDGLRGSESLQDHSCRKQGVWIRTQNGKWVLYTDLYWFPCGVCCVCVCVVCI